MLGKFISVDPLMELGSPASWNGYTYAGNNPIGGSDASGLRCIMDDGSQCAPAKRTPPSTGSSSDGTGSSGGQSTGSSDGHPKGAAVVYSGAQTDYVCIVGFVCMDGHQVTDAAGYIDRYNARIAYLTEKSDGPLVDEQYLMAIADACGLGRVETCSTQAYQQLNEMAGAATAKVAESHASNSDKIKHAVVDTSLAAATVAAGVIAGLLPSCLLRGAIGGKDDDSFSGDTRVLMADGSTKKIKDVKVGDLVLATDPETDEHGPRKVTHLWPHHDNLYTLKVNGKRIATTEDHPYWNVTDGRWERADELDRGDLLRTPDGRVARVGAFTMAGGRYADAYNLTVDDLHTYYVMAGNTPVLVHNEDGGMVGANGTQITSSTVWLRGSYRIDVENPNPGVRPGQMHFQDQATGAKYLYNYDTGQFEGMPNSLQKELDKKMPDYKKAIVKGNRFLGMGGC